MIALSDKLSKFVSEKLNKQNVVYEFTIDELNQIEEIEITKDDILYLNYFSMLKTLIIQSFPSIGEDDILLIAMLVPNLENLVIKEQSAIFNLDLSGYKKLKCLSVIHNDNLITINGIDKLDKLEIYDNKEFNDIDKLVELISNNCDGIYKIDIIYYYSLINSINLNNYTIIFIESLGLRKYMIHEYTNNELSELTEIMNDIISKYIYVMDGDVERFGILYEWFITNISFYNEDDPKEKKYYGIDSTYRAFKYKLGGRLSYAKAFQFLLRFAGLDSTIVYSMGAFDTIGYYNGEKIYSLLGSSDYALLRVKIDSRNYYLDIAWDSSVKEYNCFDKLRLFLVSKDELKIRHKFVGEANVDVSYSYHGDDSDDLIMFSKVRISDVDEMFNDIERYEQQIIESSYNVESINNEINDIKRELSYLDANDIDYESSSILKEADEYLKQEDAIVIKLNNNKKKIIESYAYFINEHYILNYNDISYSECVDYIEKKYNKNLLSKYMYNILKESIKIKMD